MRKRTKSIKRITLYICLCELLTCAGIAQAFDGLAQEKRPPGWKKDASITDVFFIDQKTGWAVGSQGLLLRTEDGGQTWLEGNLTARSRKSDREYSLTEKIQGIRAKQQIGAASTGESNSPFSCRFESVCFKDAKNGWAAGGYDLPSMNYSRAVIARTNDGGKSWQALPRLMMPRVHRIEFRGAMQRLSGWAVGNADPRTNSSIYFTSDAGNIWSNQKAKKRMPDLIDAETAGNRFVGIDNNGRLVTFDTAKLEYSVVASRSEHIFEDIEMESARVGWAVGSDGAFFQTQNGGMSWNPVIVDSEQQGVFDFRSLHSTRDTIWIAGDPGHLLFSFNRQTGKLDAHRLNRSAAINRIHFVDENHGWAVGDFGSIHATSDGGQSWTQQRAGSQRGVSQVGILAVCDSADDLPVELIAKHAGEGGKLLGVAMTQRQGSNKNANQRDTSRLSVERIGAACLTPIQISAGLDVAETKSTRLAKVIRTIRQQKPATLVGKDSRFLERCIQLAANEDAFPAQISAGLTTWQTDFLVIDDPAGDFEFDAEVFLPRMGMLLEDFVLPSRTICGLSMKPARNQRFFSKQCINRGDELQFVSTRENPLTRPGLTQRKQNAIPRVNLGAVRNIVQKRQQMRHILNMPVQSVVESESCRRTIAQMTFGVDTDRTGCSIAGLWLIQLADEFQKAGKAQQAAWALEHLVQSLPDHCFAPLANVTLARYYASAEWNQLAMGDWQNLRTNIGHAARIPTSASNPKQQVAISRQRLEGGRTEYRWEKEKFAVDLANALEEAANAPLDLDIEEELKDFDPDTVDLTLDFEEPERDDATSIQTVPSMSPPEIEAFFNGRLRQAANYYSRLAQRDPGLAKRADCQYLKAQIVKQLSSSDDAKHYFQIALKSKPYPVFSSAAAAENNLDNAQTDSAMATRILTAGERPHLDGLPNDDVWQSVVAENQLIKLTAEQGQSLQDIAMIAHDDEFLYVYARCYKRASAMNRTTSAERQRDANLTNRDRLEMSFDVDRDITSSWNVLVDYAGQAYEACGNSTSWNPKMFVAHHEDERTWSVECAIAKSDLISETAKDNIWRFNVRRQSGPMDQSNSGFWGFELPAAGAMVQFR